MSNFPVVHFEMPYDDADRAHDFYERAFGWSMQKTGPEMGNYILCGSTAAGDDGRPTEPGAINGGLYERMAGRPEPGVCLACDDIGDAVQRVTDAGGTVHGEPVQIPGVGMYVAFSDTEGNALSLLQPSM